jgi:MerR-like DNA binding protein
MALTIGKVGQAYRRGAEDHPFLYEARGVLAPASRTSSGYRQYNDDDVQHLLFIRRARGLGLPLGQLKALTAAIVSGR